MPALSVLIPTFNEAENIEAAIASVSWADEILVVDSFSTDETVAKAKALGCKVISRKYDGPAYQKNWAIPQAKHDWILILDADERATPELKTEIQILLSEESIDKDAYWIHRQNHFLGKRIRYSGWQGDKVVRLIRKEVCRYENIRVHEEIETKGISVGILKQKLLHFTYKDMDHFLAKMQRYAKWSAEDHAHKTKKVGFFHLAIKPLFRFFKHYIIGLGILDGIAGLKISVIMAWGVFLRYAYLFEQQADKNGRIS